MHGVEQPERLDGAIAQIALVTLEGRAAADVDVPQVDGRVPVHDPVCEHLAGAARGLDADGVEARRHEQAAGLGRFAEQVAVIGREALRPVEEHLYAG